MPHTKTHPLDTEADEAHDVMPRRSSGVDAALSRQRSRVQIPFGAPKVNTMNHNINMKEAAAR